ncbi:unnamed protein product [Withania somnifera]
MEPMDIVGKTKEDASLPKEFINLISLESNEVCNKEEKQTIAPEHAAYEQHKLETLDTERAGRWSNDVAEMTEEEALAAQQRMFAEARARMNGVLTVPPKQPDTEAEEKLDS